MYANVVLSVKGRKVLFKPHNDFKWEISLPIERIEVKCEDSHYIACVGYVPRRQQAEMYITIRCNDWNLPKFDKIVLPILNETVITGQILDILPCGCQSIIDVPVLKIKLYINNMKLNRPLY